MTEQARLVRRAGMPVGVGLTPKESVWQRPRAWVHAGLFVGVSVVVFFTNLSGRDILFLYLGVALFAAIDLFGWMMQQIMSTVERIEELLKRRTE